MIPVLSIPSPAQGVWHLGPVPIRGYALCIIVGIIVATLLAERRWVARGGKAGEIQDAALIGVPFAIVGARLYHVATDHDLYFGAGKNPWNAFLIWHGGLGIWGGIAGGVLGVWLYARRKHIRLPAFLDAIAPTALVGQGLGRWGNWFNQELYGGPTKLPWGLRIDKAHFSNDYLNQLQQQGKPVPDVATFHPTFLYECLWDLTGFAILIWLDRRFKIGYGRLAALYVMYYTAGRGWIENLRIDNVELHDVLGLRFNVWTSIVCFTGALAYFLWSLRRHPGKEPSVYDDQPTAAAVEAPTPTGE